MTKPLIQSGCLLFCSLMASMPTAAQVTSDGTTLTTVTSPDEKNFTIEGGDRPKGGANLFHSFRDFSVPTGGSAFFNNPVEIENIFSRVTGGKISSIDGLIRASGRANLFLINPAGIIWGQNARLALGGSFLSSTADSLLFPEGEFSAVDLDNPPLITINAPIGLGIRDEPGDIAITGDNANQTLALLEVNPGQNLTLVGGDINFDTGRIFAPGGSVELGGLSAAGVVGINKENGSLSFPDGIEQADISLTNSDILVAADGGGFIKLNARNLDLTGGSLFSAGIGENMGSVNAQAGDITIKATDTVSLDGSQISNNVESLGEGQGGNIDLTANSLVLTNRALEPNTRSLILANTLGRGDAGDVKINVGQLVVQDGSFISTSTSPDAVGQGGNLSVTASESVELIGSPVEFPPTSLLAQNFGVRDGGNLTVDTGKLIIRDGAGISTQVFNEGQGGSLTVTASESVELIGTSPSGSGLPSGLFSITTNLVTENPVGDGGDITIVTGKLIVRDGAVVDASTGGEGKGGDVTITASESVEVIGTSPIGLPSLSTESFSFSSDAEGSVDLGNAGTLKIETGQLILRDGARASTATSTNGNGGIIDISTKELSLANEAEIDVSTSGQGDAGRIEIDATSVSLSNGSVLSSETEGQGNAGQIIINATESISLSGVDSGGVPSGIFARVQREGTGMGGNVELATKTLSLNEGNQQVGTQIGVPT